MVACLKIASLIGLVTFKTSYIPIRPLYPESLHLTQPFPIRTLALEDCSGENPKSSKTLGVTLGSGSLQSGQVFLARRCANTKVHAAEIR